jgi:hypothetical protein
MNWRNICLGATVAAALSLTTLGSAEARHYRSSARFAGVAPHHVFFRHHHGFHRHRFGFVGVYPYYYGGDGCYWLRRRAIVTGSHYWWRRYHACRYGY